MLENKKNNNKEKFIIPAAITFSIYCGLSLNNKKEHIHADNINTDYAVPISHTNNSASTSHNNKSVQASDASYAAPINHDNKSAQISDASYATPISHDNKSTQISDASYEAPISHDNKSTQISDVSYAAPISHNNKSVQISNASYAAPISHDNKLTQISDTSYAAPISHDSQSTQISDTSYAAPINHDNKSVQISNVDSVTAKQVFKQNATTSYYVTISPSHVIYNNFATTQEKITYAKCAGGLRTIQVNLSQPLTGNLNNQIQFDNGGGIASISENGNILTITTKEDIDPSQLMEIKLPNYNIVYDIRQENGAMMEKMVQSKEFNDKYTYNGNDLGYTYTKNSTQFKEWFPTAQQVLINFYNGTSANASLKSSQAMQKGPNGSWIYNYQGDAKDTAYTFTLKFADGSSETIYDPEAIACVAGGERSVVLSPEEMSISDENDLKQLPGIAPTDAIIGEINIRDFTKDSSSGVQSNLRGTFLGAVQSGTKNANGQPTGIDYLRQEGYTNIQIMPMFQYDDSNDQQNWGYNPKNYNVPEGWYSTNRDDPATRIKECKEMIAAFHKAGLRVNMDVVYNHVANPGDNALIKSCPGYFLRYDDNGNLQNTSGCGNDINSEMTMARKYIVNSIDYWSKEYGIDGFRFDLMGNLDIQTMNTIRDSLKNINPEAMLYGEGWNLGSKLNDGAWQADQWNEKEMPSIGTFNGYGRDTIRGGGDGTDKGFVDGDTSANTLSKLANMIVGTQNQSNTPSGAVDHDAQYDNPGQVINYSECHDNKTLFDKIKGIYPNEPDNVIMRRAELANSITGLVEGVPFYQVGQEFGRSKNGDPNSYNTGDAENSIKWNNENEFSWAVAYQKGLDKLREEVPGFRYGNYNDINKNIQWCEIGNGIVGYKMTDPTGTYIIAFNGNMSDAILTGVNNGNYQILIQNCNSYVDNPLNVTINNGQIKIASLSTLVMRLNTPKPKDQFIGSNNKYFYYDNNENMVHGWQTIDGHKQYYDLTTGEQYKMGTYTIDGKEYTFDNLGNLVQNSSTPTSHTNSSTPTSHTNSSTPTSHANSSAPTSHANSSAPTSHTNSSTPTSHANSSSPTSHANSSSPTSHANSSAPTSSANNSNTNNTTPTSSANNSNTNNTTPTSSATNSNTSNVTPISSATNSNTSNVTPISSATNSNTNNTTPTSSATNGNTSNVTSTSSATNGNTSNVTPTGSVTNSNTNNVTPTSSATNSNTNNVTPISSVANSNTSNATPTSSATNSNTNNVMPTGSTINSNTNNAMPTSSLFNNAQLIQTNNKTDKDIDLLTVIGLSLTELLSISFINKKKE